MGTRSRTPDLAEELTFAGDLPTFNTRVNTDVFHISEDTPPSPRSPSPTPSVSPHRPWYKTASPIWLMPLTVIAAMLMAATIAPRQELFIKLACNELRPDYLLFPPPSSSLLDIPYDPQLPIYVPSPAPPDRPRISIPSPDERCTSDPAVQAESAKLQAAMATGMGVLGCLTTGPWSQLSDRVGRAPVLALSMIGFLFTDAVLILVAFYADILPGGFRFLIVGSILNGALGGTTTAMAVSHAYVSDTVEPAARSRIFSYLTGSLFAGMAFGPALGAVLTRYTNDLLTIFYVATAFHVAYAMFCFFVIPESLDVKHRTTAMERYKANRDPRATWFTHVKHAVSTFARPLVVFIPHKRPSGKGRDWSLTLIGITYASSMLNIGSYTFKFQYAIGQFSWHTTELAYWMSLMGISRAAFLLIILPWILKGLQKLYRESKYTHVDLLVGRLSLGVEILGYIVLSLTTDPTLFVVASCWMSLRGGFAPAVQSIALALSQDHAADKKRVDGDRRPEHGSAPSETGTLFGALSVLEAITSQIIGPPLFGLVFVNTISTAPRAIFWTSLGCVSLSLFALCMVRLKKEETIRAEETDEERRLL